LYTLDMAFLPSNSEGCRNPAALFYSGLAGVRLMPEAEVNLGTLNGSFEDVGYQGATESETAYIGWGGAERARSSHQEILSHILFF